MQAEAFPFPDWRNADAYSALLEADRSLIAWEWLRRDDRYRAAAFGGSDAGTGAPEGFGLARHQVGPVPHPDAIAEDHEGESKSGTDLKVDGRRHVAWIGRIGVTQDEDVTPVSDERSLSIEVPELRLVRVPGDGPDTRSVRHEGTAADTVHGAEHHRSQHPVFAAGKVSGFELI